MSSIFNSKTNQNLATLVLIGMVLALMSYSYLTLKSVNKNELVGPATINVVGNGDVTSTPDVAQFSFSVRGEGVDAVAAQAQSGNAINAITAYLKENGIEEKDIKTENYNLNPKYKYEIKPCMAAAYCPPGNQVSDGFEVSQTISVKVRAMDKASALISNVGQKGATDISGLNFIIDKPEVAKAQARDLAIADAKAQASALAKSLGVTLVKITSYYEDGQGGMMPYAANVSIMDSRMEGKSDFAGANLPAGENKITSRVNLTYEIK